ncbi:MAG: Mut7-C RNAse domain-containing protein [Stellaceae bacterium]
MPRFLCDEMLRGLGRWLRAAGYDTVIAAGGLPDRALAVRCAEEDRVLLTKDRHLAAIVAGSVPMVLVPGDGIDEAARALRIAVAIDWQHAPFTRCIVDNRPLETAPPDLATRVPERSRAAGGPLRMCPECRRVYWPGGHVRRMQQRLAAWQQEATSPR